MNPSLSPLFLAGALLFSASAPSAQFDLSAVGGSLGRAAELQVSGPAGTQFLLFLSTRPGPLPLAWVDPGDPRALALSLDVLPILAGLAPALASWKIPIPAEPSLAGLLVRSQALAVPGSGGRLFGALSPPRGLHLWPAAAFEPLPARMPFNRIMAAGLTLADGRLLMTGGGQGAMLALVAGKECLWFDPVERKFAKGPDMSVERGLHTATALLDGRILLACGVNYTNDPQDSLEVFDPVQGICIPLAATSRDKRSAHSASRLPDGRVLLAGGISDMNGMLQALGSIVATTDLFDPVQNSVSKGPDLATPRVAHLAAKLPDGRILLAGGASWRSVLFIKIPYFSDSSDLFDPATGKITAGPTMKVARGFGSSLWLKNGKLLVVGGASGDLSQLGAPTAACELFDPATGLFAATGSLAAPRAAAALFLLPDGRVLAAGGMQGDLFNPLALTSSELYDPATGAWSPGPPLGAGRTGAFEALLPDGTLLLLGGASAGPNGTAQDTGELFHP